MSVVGKVPETFFFAGTKQTMLILEEEQQRKPGPIGFLSHPLLLLFLPPRELFKIPLIIYFTIFFPLHLYFGLFLPRIFPLATPSLKFSPCSFPSSRSGFSTLCHCEITYFGRT